MTLQTTVIESHQLDDGMRLVPLEGNDKLENSKPTADDIRLAIMNVEARNWLDPSRVPHYWDCTLYDSNGEEAGEGQAHSAGQAMAMAWLHMQAPDALIDAYVEADSVELNVPDGWQFKLTPPQPTLAAAIAWIHRNFQEFEDVA